MLQHSVRAADATAQAGGGEAGPGTAMPGPPGPAAVGSPRKEWSEGRRDTGLDLLQTQRGRNRSNRRLVAH